MITLALDAYSSGHYNGTERNEYQQDNLREDQPPHRSGYFDELIHWALAVSEEKNGGINGQDTQQDCEAQFEHEYPVLGIKICWFAKPKPEHQACTNGGNGTQSIPSINKR